MTRSNLSSTKIRYAVSGVLAVGLLAGCAGSSKLARAGDSAARAEKSQSGSSLNKAVASAEAAVAATPTDAAARSTLGHAYLDAGRFELAAASFADALDLGDTNGRTALSLALAETGAGRSRDAVATLDQWREAIPASDLGLAMALAGETGRGVAILADAIRNGDNTPKARQNLAYAYALDGRWREARLMASQDLTADQVDTRLGQWASQGRPEDATQRVASLLDVTARPDQGQPQHLALGTAAAPAAEAVAAAPQPSGLDVAITELPPVSEASAVDFAAAPEPAQPAEPVASLASFDDSAAPAPVAPVRTPQATPRQAKVRPAVAFQTSAPRAAKSSGHASSHHAQLGAFLSEANAQRAKKLFVSRNPELRNYDLNITPAVVNGRNFWRVAAAGFATPRLAFSLCSSVKVRGGACFAYDAVARSAAPGAPARNTGVMRARR